MLMKIFDLGHNYYHIVASVLCGVVCFIAWLWIGLFDRPKFEDIAYLQSSRRRKVWCLLAMTNDKPNNPIEANKLFHATKQLLLENERRQQQQQQQQSKDTSSSSTKSSCGGIVSSSSVLSKAAFYYGSVPDYDPSSSCIACSVYFEEQGRTHTTHGSKTTNRNISPISTFESGQEKYRCGYGYLIGIDSTEEAKSLLANLSLLSAPAAAAAGAAADIRNSSRNININNDPNRHCHHHTLCPYPIRVMDLGVGPARKGRVRWRNRYTPWIARILHWNSEFSTHCGGDVEIVECELFIGAAATDACICSTTTTKTKTTTNNGTSGSGIVGRRSLSAGVAFVDYLLLNAKATTVWGPHDVQSSTTSTAIPAAPSSSSPPTRRGSRRSSWRKKRSKSHAL
jgi:hypothetical protein